MRQVSISSKKDKLLNYSDFELIDRVLTGHPVFFEELVHRYKKSVYYLTYRMVHNREDALDLSQETFLKAYQGLRKFKKRSSFHTWLYKIAINLCINHLRRRGARQYIELEKTHSVEQPVVLEKLEREELQVMVATIVDTLPEKQRAAVILRIYHGLSHKEIAGILGCSVGTVKANYFHAIRNLRKVIASHHEFEAIIGNHEL
ncbi:sigma-70 family RNA polymerase sigma factor [candidate division KSB3 bacterium]|uniref:Sigma-70 family RNA polymerase sigma factor n=1 Tax=candidate division KSB3 bacterium TaxID=2044937 RepID=A0A9D5JZ27_9BACT|nr:sigma-70 family RNA polymerase sigma factor [candidate division KSB3 bacterium]MBD3326437.1 sigma-70 family RNA polymerase sigma factor [candidate division KSB3 bacterium]